MLLLDQATKWWVQQTMPDRPPIEVLGDWLQITYTLNPGAAFSMGGSFTVILSAIAVGVSIVIVRVASRLGSVAWAVALGGILGGALGNLIDRIFREPGTLPRARRRLDLGPELAGVQHRRRAIVCSAVLMVWLSLRGYRTRRHPAADARGRCTGIPDSLTTVTITAVARSRGTRGRAGRRRARPAVRALSHQGGGPRRGRGGDVDGAPAAKSDRVHAGVMLEVELPERPPPSRSTPSPCRG